MKNNLIRPEYRSKEVWRPTKGIPRCEVSNCGRVRKEKKYTVREGNKIRKIRKKVFANQVRDSNGLKVSLHGKYYYVKNLVADAFLMRNGETVFYRDGDELHCAVPNLYLRGQKRRLSDGQLEHIKMYVLMGNVARKKGWKAELARAFMVNPTMISTAAKKIEKEINNGN